MPVSPIKTLTISKPGATATLTIERMGDGSYQFTDKDGHVCREHGLMAQDAMRRLFEALDALA